jgi:serine/threonine protein kinase
MVSKEALLGQHVGAFIIELLVAAGGMGDAYLAHDQRTKRVVLLKLLAPGLLGDVAAHARFAREAAALRRLDHPGVQRLIDTGTSGLRPFMALNYIPGETLRGVAPSRPSTHTRGGGTRRLAGVLPRSWRSPRLVYSPPGCTHSCAPSSRAQ